VIGVAGCWLLVAGYWLLVAGCWLLDAGYWLLVTGCWLLTLDRKVLNRVRETSFVSSTYEH